MGWLYLIIATILEIGWPVGIKIATQSPHKWLWIILAVLTTSLGFLFFYLAQKTIPIGTAYSIWTGIGAAGTFLIGVLLFGDSLNLLRTLGVVIIISGVICLKIGN